MHKTMNKIMRMPEVINFTGISRATIYRLIKAGEFPKPLKLSKGIIGWTTKEIERWIRSRTH